jgi:large subunit ribosomal protein L2
LGLCPVGVEVSNVELKPGFGGQVCRAAGTFAVLVKKDPVTQTVILKLKSGWFLRVSEKCLATLGMVSNIQHKFFVKRKAGFVRNFGRRPVVRGVAMNPIDHPHGGGEGKASGGKTPKTPWGLGTKGRKTVSKRTRKRKAFYRFK